MPGDLLILTKGMQLPCDCIMVKGELLMNEANLTGEIDPVPKFPITPNPRDLYDLKKHNSNTLLEGATIVNTSHDTCIGFVFRTGFYSYKGQIIRILLFPK